jgi:biopolymer transport protein ExbB
LDAWKPAHVSDPPGADPAGRFARRRRPSRPDPRRVATDLIRSDPRESLVMPTWSQTERRWGGGRALGWALFVLGGLTVLALAPAPGEVRAQEPAKDAPAAKDAQAPKAEEPAPRDEPAEAKPAGAAAGTAPPREGKTMLKWFLDAAGPIGLFLVLISVYMLQLVIRLFMELRVSEAVPPPLVERIETAIKERKFQEAYDACRDNDSFLARLVRTGVANLPNGRPEAKEAMTTTSEEIVTGMEQRIGYLAIIGQLGPLIGLVGTILGMIMSFQEIAFAAGAQPKPEKVAEGISTALVITLLGISLSVPAIFFFALFRNRVALMTMEATRVADRVINSLVTAAKQAKSA